MDVPLPFKCFTLEAPRASDVDARATLRELVLLCTFHWRVWNSERGFVRDLGTKAETPPGTSSLRN